MSIVVDQQSDSATAAAERWQRALAALTRGRAVVLCDRADHAAHAELVFPAADATTSAVAFSVRHGSGFLRVALPEDRCDRLLLPSMTAHADPGREQLAVSVDAATGITTGISASDRARAAQLLADPRTVPDDLTRPGHTVPVRVDMARSPQTFAAHAVNLTTAAHRPAATVMSALVGLTDPTHLLTGDDVEIFAKHHGFPMLGIDDIRAVMAPVHEQMWDSLLTMSALVEGELDRRLRQEHDLTHSYYRILAHLASCLDRRDQVSHVATRLSFSISRLSHALDRLESEGWVARADCPDGSNAAQACLTKAGLRRYEQARNTYRTVLNQMPPATPDLSQMHAATARSARAAQTSRNGSLATAEVTA